MDSQEVKNMLRAYHLNCSDTKNYYKKYYQTIDSLNLRLKQLFDMDYFRLRKR